MRFLLSSCGVRGEIASDQICTIRRGRVSVAGIPDLVSDDGDADDHVFAGEWSESVAGEQRRQWLPDGDGVPSRGVFRPLGRWTARFSWSIGPVWEKGDDPTGEDRAAHEISPPNCTNLDAVPHPRLRFHKSLQGQF